MTTGPRAPGTSEVENRLIVPACAARQAGRTAAFVGSGRTRAYVIGKSGTIAQGCRPSRIEKLDAAVSGNGRSEKSPVFGTAPPRGFFGAVSLAGRGGQ